MRVEFRWEKVEACRNFANKVWNAARFILMNLENLNIELKPVPVRKLELPDRWIISKYNRLVEEVTDNANHGRAVNHKWSVSYQDPRLPCRRSRPLLPTASGPISYKLSHSTRV